MDTKDRLRQVLNSKNYTAYAIRRDFNLNGKMVNDQINGSVRLSLQVLEAVLTRFPDVSAEYILRGEGEMIRREDQTINNYAHANGGNANAGGVQTINGDQSELIAIKDAQIEELKRDKERLMKMLENLTTK